MYTRNYYRKKAKKPFLKYKGKDFLVIDGKPISLIIELLFCLFFFQYSAQFFPLIIGLLKFVVCFH